MKISEHPGLLDFVNSNPAATVAVPIDTNGTIHAASLLYWNTEEPFELYFITSRKSEKYKLLEKQKKIPCAIVTGTEKGTPFTLQMRGRIQEINPVHYKQQVDAYYKKRGNRNDDIDEADICILKHKPSWARFTDYSKDYERHFLNVD